MKMSFSVGSTVLLCSLLLSSVYPLTVQAAQSEAKAESKKAKPKASTDKPKAEGKAQAGKQATKEAGKQSNPAAAKEDGALKACLSRIPKDSSRGQRMVAEQGCQREEKARTSSGDARQF
jgi:hypothetical protein